VLRELAETQGVGDICDAAWTTETYLQRMLADVEAAQRIGLTGVPTLVVGPRAFAGAVSIDTLEEALRREGVEEY
jgi:predicted DsbA family dithiol-disulfide isomerase